MMKIKNRFTGNAKTDGFKKKLYLCTVKRLRKDGGVVERGGLENR